MHVIGGKQYPRGAVKEVADGEDARDQRDSEVSCDGAYEEFTDCEDNYRRDGSIHWYRLEGAVIVMALYTVPGALLDRAEKMIIELQTVMRGSLIKMTGPKRGINLFCNVLIEYDMKIKTGEQEKDDLQLIDGVRIIDELLTSSKPCTNRIHGDSGAIDIARMCVSYAFEATLEVAISEVHSSFDLCLSCYTSGVDEEIWLFDGVIGEPYGLRRHGLAVRRGKCLDLKFKVGSGFECSAEYCHSFKATSHGCGSAQIKIGFALVTLKVTWSSLEF